MDEREHELLRILETNHSQLEDLDKPTLVEIIRILRKKVDELENVKRTPEGEEIVQDDEVVKDEEEYMK